MSDDTPTPTQNEDRPWICHGSETSEHEDLLIGNRAGLEILRSAIEQALREGDGAIQKYGSRRPGIEYAGVRVVETDPRERRKNPPTFEEKLTTAGCLLLLVSMLVLAFLGLRSLPTLFP